MDDFDVQHQERKSNYDLLQALAFILVIFGVVIFVCFVSLVNKSHSIPANGQTLSFEHWGAFGDFTAGVVGTCFSLAGFIFLVITLKISVIILIKKD